LSFPESQSGSEGGVDPDFGLRESTKELLIDQETLRSTVADSSIETGARRTTLDGVVDEPGHASLPSEAVPQTQSQVRPSGSMPSSLGSQTSEVSPQSGSPLLRPAPLDSTSAEATESLLEAEARRPGGLDQPQLPSSGVEQAGPYSRVSQMDSLDLPRPDQGHQKAGSSLGAASPGLHATRDTDTVREATEALLKAEAGISADIREMGLVSTPIERTSPMSEPQSQVSRGFDGDFDVQDSTKEVPFEQAAMPSTLASSQSETSALRSTPDGSAVSPHASSLPPTTSIAPQLEVSPHSPSSSVGPLASEGEPRTGSLMPADSIRAITETLLEAESPAVAGSKPALFSNAPIDPSEAKPLGSQPSSLELRRPEEARALADSSIDSGLPDSSSPPDTSSIREETESLLNAQSRAGDDRIQTTSPDPQIVKTLSMREAEALRGVRRDPGANQSEVTEGGPIDQVAQPMSQAKSLPLDALVVPLGSEPHHVPSTPPSVSAVHATSLGSVIRDEGVRNGANEDKPAPETNSQDSLGGLRSLPKKIEETRDHRSTDRAAQLDLTSDRASASIREVTESLLDAAAFDVDGRHDIARSASAAHGESPQAEPASLSGESIHPQSAPDVLSEELRRSASTSERVQESQAEPDSQAAAQRSPRLRDEGSSTIHAIPIAPAGLTTVRSSESIREVTDALCYAVTNGGEDAKGSISWTPSAMRTILDGSSQDSAEMVTHRAASTSALNEESLVVGDMPLSESNLADASPSVAVRGHARPSAGATKPGSSSEEGVESIRDAGRSPLTFVASSAGASDDTGQSAHSGPQGAAAPEHSPRSGGLHRQDTASKEATEVIVSEPRVVSANLQQASPLSTTVQESHLAMNAPEIRSSSPTMQNAAERVRPGDSSDHIVRQDAELERGPDSNRQNAKSPFVATSQRVEDPAIVSSAPTSTTPSAAATVSESSIAGVRNQQAVLRGITEELLVEHSSQPSPQATAGHREPNHESSPSSLISRASDGNNNQDDRRPQDQLHAVLPAAKSGAHSSLQSESPAESTISNEKPGLAVPEENRLGTEDRSVAHVDGDRFQSSKPTNNAESAPRLHSTRPDLEPPEADLSTAQSRPSPGSVNYHVRVAPRMRHHRLGETAPSPTMPTHFMPWPATPLSDVAANLEIPNSQPSPEHFRAEGRRVLRVLPPARNVGKSPTPFFIGEAPLDALLNTAATEAALVPFAQGPRVTTEPMEPVLEAGVTPLIDTPPVPRQSVSTSIAPVEGPPSRRLPRTSAIDSTLLDALPSDSVEAFRQILKHNTTALAAEPLPQRQEPADIPREAGFQSKRAAPRETGPSEINLHIASISLPDDAPPETKMKAPRGKPRLSLAAYLKSRNEGR
jgi:hypothetical protein